MKITLKDGTKVYITPFQAGEPKCTDDEKAQLVIIRKMRMPGGIKIHRDVFPYSIRMLEADKDGFYQWVTMDIDSMSRIARFFSERENKGLKMLAKWWWLRSTYKYEVKP